MWKNFNRSVMGLSLVALMAVAGFFALQLPVPASAKPSEAEVLHSRSCSYCAVPYYAPSGQPSWHGPDPHAVTPAPPSVAVR
jgi:hypothetical protein